MAGIATWMRHARGRFSQRMIELRNRIMMIAQYQYINTIDAQDVQIRLMNYGWIDPETHAPLMPLDAEDEPDRYALQLYHRVAGAVDLRGKDVLEVGSGRGGGAAYIAKYLGPRLVHGVDLCASSAIFCNSFWKRPCLTFSRGDAERLPQPDASFDAVVNIESSHCYPHMERFVAHAYRVLRPGGHLLFADLRHFDAVDLLRDELRAPGFEIIEDEELNAGVVLALDAEDARKRAFIEAKVRGRRRPIFELFSAIKGTPMYRAIVAGDARYVRFTLRKPGD